MTLLRQTIVVVALVAGAARVEAQSQLHGRIVSDSGKPIAGATITLGGVRYSVKSDSLGQFRLAGTPGSTLELTLVAIGFRDQSVSVVLTRGRLLAREFVLVSEATPEPEVNPSDQVLRVRVTTTDGEPIAYSNLQVNGGRRYVSDDSGRVVVPIAITNRASILVRRIGYEPTEVQLTAMPDTAIRIQMKAVARTLETQTVTVRSPFTRLELGGFYARMNEVQNGARVGYFVTPEDLALRNPQNVTDAVEQFPGIRLRPIDDGKVSPDGMYHADGMPLRRKFRIEDRNGCAYTVYLDRIRIQPSVNNLVGVDEEINSIIHPNSVAGIEVYPRSANAPPGFPAANATRREGPSGALNIGECGVVLIWSR